MSYHSSVNWPTSKSWVSALVPVGNLTLVTLVLSNTFQLKKEHDGKFQGKTISQYKGQIGAKLRCTFDNYLTVKTYTYLRFSGVSIVK